MYAIKSGKVFWAPAGKIYKAGWCLIEDSKQSADIVLFNNKAEALLNQKILSRKYCKPPSVRIVDLKNDKKLETLLMAKLKYK